MSEVTSEYPLITVVTVVYNTGKFVLRGLESLLQQQYPADKIQHIIVDDFSTDDSVALIEAWLFDHPDHACTFIKHEKNYGLCKSLNDGLKLARGKYFSGMGDDLWKPERLRLCIEEFEKLPEDYALLYTPIDICDENDQVFETNVLSKPKRSFTDPFVELLTSGVMIPATSSIHRVSALIEVGGYDERLSFEDVDLILRLCGKYKFHLLNNSLSIYRKNLQNPNSLSDKAHRSFDIVSDMLKMNASALGQSVEKDDLLVSAYLDELEIWYLLKYNKKFSLRKARRYHTILTPFLLRIFRDKRQFTKYYISLLRLLLFKKYSPYGTRDIFFLAKKYFDKEFTFH
jgi:glycosyltransferase involved in cell wall biosynthesis